MTDAMTETDRKVLVLGAGGQLGRALMKKLGARGIGLTRAEADLGKPETLLGVLDGYSPEAVINAAAYTQVDRAEEEEQLAFCINGEAPGVIARWCAIKQVPFVHFSTDYVFDGSGSDPWLEEDPPSPLNAYGRSKLIGENLVEAAGGQWMILRTSWVYDAVGHNFFTTMLRLGKEREALRVVNDQYGAPTYAPHLAAEALQVLDRAVDLVEFPSDIYHLCGAGETTWSEFAGSIFAAARERGLELKVKTVEPIATADYPTPAQRPLNSRLDTSRIHDELSVQMPHWQVGLSECLNEYCNTPCKA
jgi:dTDP-4-dehydrorhamnose reductase